MTQAAWQRRAINTATYTNIEKVRSDVNVLMSEVIRARQIEALGAAERYGALWKAIENYISSGGKRIRPYVTVMGYELYGGNVYESIIKVAAAQEFLNQAMLMHDDIIDRDYVRYGVSNVAGQLLEYYRDTKKYPETHAKHYADAAALLAGDLCISEASMLVRQSGFTPEQLLMVENLLHEAIFMVVGGELLDSETYKSVIAESDPLTIIRLKTAIYSIVVPLLCGATLAGADDTEQEKLRDFGEKLGMAYQLADDAIGVFGDESITGKTAIGDLREGKHTYLMKQAWLRANKSDKQLLERLFGNPDLTSNGAETIRSVIIRSGAREDNNAMITKLVSDAITTIDTLEISEGGKQTLRNFCEIATKRDK